MPDLTPCLWFDTDGEAAAELYTSVFPNSKILEVTRYGAAGPRPEGTWLKDRFGLSWQVVPNRLPELLGDEDKEKAQRVMAAMLEMGKIEIAELERAAEAA